MKHVDEVGDVVYGGGAIAMSSAKMMRSEWAGRGKALRMCLKRLSMRMENRKGLRGSLVSRRDEG